MTPANKPQLLSPPEAFLRAAGDLGVEISPQAGQQFSLYAEELLTWNEKINLISLKKQEELWNKHFLDSLSAAPFMKKSGRLLDIGTGAGLPGLPLAIVMPQWKLYLLESSRKKSSFLKQVLRKLSLPDATVINARVEEVLTKPVFQNFFDLVISRAAFKLPALLRYAARFLVAGGALLAMKGTQVLGEELAEAERVAPGLGFSPARCENISLGLPESRRVLVIYRKNFTVDTPSAPPCTVEMN